MSVSNISLSAWKQRAQSAANVRLNDILATLQDLEEQCANWLDDHGDTCPCCWCSQPFCKTTGTTDGMLAENDLRGLLYNLQTATSIVGGQIHVMDADELEAARARLDAGIPDDQDGADADEPAAVVIAVRTHANY